MSDGMQTNEHGQAGERKTAGWERTNNSLKKETKKDNIPMRIQLEGNSHQILLSGMSLPGVKVPVEKLLPKILGRLGKENPSKRRCNVAFVQRKCAVTSSVLVRFQYATYN